MESSEVSPLEQKPELAAVETIEPIDISLDQTRLEAEETLEYSEVLPFETIEPIDVLLDQTRLEAEETL